MCPRCRSCSLCCFSFAQAPTFKSDPPHKCDSCDEWNKPREPFKLFGNSYYVGTDGLSAILIAGDAGHILLDGGLEQSAAVIDANIRKLGFKTEDIKLIVNSHGHYDHAGGIAALQRASGATVAASPSGADALQRGENTTDDPQYGFGKAVQRLSAGQERQGDQGQRSAARRQRSRSPRTSRQDTRPAARPGHGNRARDRNA